MILPPIAELIPHTAPMILLDRVISASPEQLTAEVTIRPDSPFCDGQRVGGWVGIEYMAQTIAALAGWTARQKNDPVRLGFLVGTRQYRSQTPWFQVGDILHVSVHREIDGDNGVSAVVCHINSPEGLLHAAATITVFQPDNLEEFLKTS
ncbi:MAG: hotdog family protein [Formivibrio sp.]|nr:hotdog family protein [Formivibrio sp.]